MKVSRVIPLSLLLFLVAALLLLIQNSPVQPDSTPEEGPRPRIVYIFKADNDSSEFWSWVISGIQAGCREYNYQYMVVGANRESDIQGNIDAVADAIAMEPDVIVLSAAGYYQLEEAARQVVDAGIPLLTLDSAVSGDWSRCFIGSDNYQVGRLMGEELRKRIPGEGKIAFMGNVEGARSTEDRLQGAYDALQALGEDRLLEPVYCANQARQARSLLLDLMEAHPDICGVIAINEDSALGVGDAVADLGLQDSIAVVTCDNTSGQISYLEQGVIDATIAQRPFNMGYFSIQIADRILHDKNADIPAFYDTGNAVITVENYFTVENQKLLFPFSE